MLAKFPKLIFVCPLSMWKRRNIDITMLRLLKILHITHNENESEVNKNIEMNEDENKSCALLTCSICHKIYKDRKSYLEHIKIHIERTFPPD